MHCAWYAVAPVVLKRRYQRVQKPWQRVPKSRRCGTPGAGLKPGNLFG